MKSANYYKVRRVVRVMFWLAILTGFYLISSRLWWNGAGWCVGTIERCGL